LLALAGCLLGSLACTPPQATPVPEHLRVAVAPSAAPLLDELGAHYRARHSYVTLEPLELGAANAIRALRNGTADLAFVERTLDPAETLDPETGRERLTVWPLATGALAVVVHPSNPVPGLTLEQLQGALTGSVRRWSELGGEDRTIGLVCREPGAPLRDAFERGLGGTRVIGSAVVMPGDEAIADYVASHPGAIGYISAPWAGEQVKVLALDGALPDVATVAEGRYPLTYPLLLVTPSAISSKAKAFVDYVYSHEGQGMVRQSYAPAR